mgnify:CR=1 FL=1
MIVLDEPTASLDLGAAAEMGRLLPALAAEWLAILVVVHDLALAAALADELVVLARGRTAATRPGARRHSPGRRHDQRASASPARPRGTAAGTRAATRPRHGPDSHLGPVSRGR